MTGDGGGFVTVAAVLALGAWTLVLALTIPPRQWPDKFAAAIVYFACLVPIASVLASPRSAGVAGYTTLSSSPLVEKMAHYSAYAAVAAVPVAMLLSVKRRPQFSVPMFAVAAYGFVGLLSAFANGQPLEIGSAYSAAVFFSVGLLRRWDTVDGVKLGRCILRIYIWGSLILAAAAPGMAFWVGQERNWIGLPQLAGVTPHPNGLGSVAAIAVFVEAVGIEGKRRSLLNWSAALLALVLTQSRGAWLAVAVGLLVYLVARRRRPAGWVVGGVLAGVASISLTQRLAADLAGLTSVEDAATLNGRTLIWEHLWPIIQAHPILGVGPLAFDRRFIGTTLGLPSDPSHANAHNQIIQTLVERGAVGLFLVLLLIGGLLLSAGRHPAIVRGGLMAMAAVFTSRFLVETPLFIFPASLNAALLLVVVVMVSTRPTPAEELAQGGVNAAMTSGLGGQPEADGECPQVVGEGLRRGGVGRSGRDA